MVKSSIFLRKHPSMNQEEFGHYHKTIHAKLSTSVDVVKQHVVKYIRMSSFFICEIGVEYSSKLLKIASMLVAGNYFLRKHINEGGPLFAKNIEARFSA